MNKGEMILGIVELYDQIAELKSKASEPLTLTMECEAGADGSDRFDAYMIAAGKKTVLERSLYSWKECRAWKDEETGAVVATEYNKWVKEKISNLPDYMSKQEFARYFDAELRDMYEDEKSDAIAKLAVTGDGDE